MFVGPPQAAGPARRDDWATLGVYRWQLSDELIGPALQEVLQQFDAMSDTERLFEFGQRFHVSALFVATADMPACCQLIRASLSIVRSAIHDASPISSSCMSSVCAIVRRFGAGDSLSPHVDRECFTEDIY